MINKTNWIRFFGKTFLVTNISLKVVFGMFFLTLSNADIDFLDRELWWKTYTTKKALLTIRRIELVRKKEFTTVVLNPEYETFIVHIASLDSYSSLNFILLNADIDPLCRLQIVSLITKKASIKIPDKYINFADIFFPNLVFELPEHTKINDHAIDLVNGQQPFYGPIYSLRLVELEILKAYIETNLANKFIRPFKSPTSTPIFFNQKSDSFF